MSTSCDHTYDASGICAKCQAYDSSSDTKLQSRLKTLEVALRTRITEVEERAKVETQSNFWFLLVLMVAGGVVLFSILIAKR